MAKKHRLKINYSEITEDNFEMVRELRKHDLDGNIVDDSMTILQFIKKSWLTEIKEPLSFEEWDKAQVVSVPDDIYFKMAPKELSEFIKSCHMSGWKAALENQKLGQVVDEEEDHKARLDYLSSCPLLPCNREIWNAALKYARRTPCIT